MIDTSVVVTALRSRHGAGNRVMRLIAARQLVPLATPPLFLEYEDVLNRPEQRLAHGLSPMEIDKFLSHLAALIEPVDIHFQWRPQMRDPADEMVLEAAINGRADAIVTHNVIDFSGISDWFSMPILRPGDLLKQVDK